MLPIITPLLSALASLAASWYWGIYPSFANSDGAVSFGGTVASISTTMLGFMMAALAVLASINQTHLVKMMRQYGHYKDLVHTLVFGCLLFLACAVLGLLMLFGLPSSPRFLCAVVALHVGAFVSLIEVGVKLWLVLTNLRDQ